MYLKPHLFGYYSRCRNKKIVLYDNAGRQKPAVPFRQNKQFASLPLYMNICLIEVNLFSGFIFLRMTSDLIMICVYLSLCV